MSTSKEGGKGVFRNIRNALRLRKKPGTTREFPDAATVPMTNNPLYAGTAESSSDTTSSRKSSASASPIITLDGNLRGSTDDDAISPYSASSTVIAQGTPPNAAQEPNYSEIESESPKVQKTVSITKEGKLYSIAIGEGNDKLGKKAQGIVTIPDDPQNLQNFTYLNPEERKKILIDLLTQAISEDFSLLHEDYYQKERADLDQIDKERIKTDKKRIKLVVQTDADGNKIKKKEYIDEPTEFDTEELRKAGIQNPDHFHETTIQRLAATALSADLIAIYKLAEKLSTQIETEGTHQTQQNQMVSNTSPTPLSRSEPTREDPIYINADVVIAQPFKDQIAAIEKRLNEGKESHYANLDAIHLQLRKEQKTLLDKVPDQLLAPDAKSKVAAIVEALEKIQLKVNSKGKRQPTPPIRTIQQ